MPEVDPHLKDFAGLEPDNTEPQSAQMGPGLDPKASFFQTTPNRTLAIFCLIADRADPAEVQCQHDAEDRQDEGFD